MAQTKFTTITWQEFVEKYKPQFEMPFDKFAKDVPIRVYSSAHFSKFEMSDVDEEQHADNELCNIVIDGDLEIDGRLSIYAESSGNFLLILGNLKAASVAINGCSTLEVRGKSEITHGIATIYGDDGGFLVLNDVVTPFLLNGLYFNLTLKGKILTIKIDYGSHGVENPDFTSETLDRILVAEVFKTTHGKTGEIDWPKFKTCLEEGRAILKV